MLLYEDNLTKFFSPISYGQESIDTYTDRFWSLSSIEGMNWAFSPPFLRR